MFSKFFEQLTTNAKKGSNNLTSRIEKKGNLTQGRISSLSPPASQKSKQFYFPQYSPVPLPSKKIQDCQVDSNLAKENHNTNPRKSTQNPKKNISNVISNSILKENTKKHTNLAFQPLDKESLLGSTAEGLNEDRKLIQNIPQTRTSNLSQLFKLSENKENNTNHNLKSKASKFYIFLFNYQSLV